MTIERLNEIHQAKPFRPCIMHFADGGRLEITHPESIAYSPSGRTIVVVLPDDRSQWIDLLLVSRFELLNGATRKLKRH